jgi:hypothetical protein
MAKKCIPGVICIENMTLFFLLLTCLLAAFLFFTLRSSQNNLIRTHYTHPLAILSPTIDLARNDVFSDPYFPPLKDNMDGPFVRPPIFQGTYERRGVPINMETQRTGRSFNQIGVLTRSGNINGELILPIFGRDLLSNRNKWQYYTLSNTGNISSKLPVRVHGKDGMSEYGVDEINNGDVIYVQGYNDIFLATIYDSRGNSYIPYL